LGAAIGKGDCDVLDSGMLGEGDMLVDPGRLGEDDSLGDAVCKMPPIMTRLGYCAVGY
jgi:hypothetical protein